MVYRSRIRLSNPSIFRSQKPPVKYPGTWKQFSWSIRFGRAKGHCELCGAKHGTIHPYMNRVCYLTTAHLDYPGGICTCFKQFGMKCTNPEHVLALCIRCHAIIMRACKVNPVIVPPVKVSVNKAP